jgi:hypothetical protein
MKGASDALSLNTDPPRAATLYSVQRSAEATTSHCCVYLKWAVTMRLLSVPINTAAVP